MNARNKNVLVILMAGMAIGISSFGSPSKLGSRDLALTSSDDYADDDGGERVATGNYGDIDQVVEAAVQSNPQVFSIKDDGKDEVTAEAKKETDGSFTATVTANASKDHEVTSTVHARDERGLRKAIKTAQEKNLKRSQTKKERLEAKKKEAKDLKKKIANCEMIDKKTEIEENDVDGKAECFKDRMRDMDAKERKAYIAKVVKPYVDKQQAPALQALASADPHGANATVALASLTNLRDTLNQYGLAAPFANDFNLAIQTAQMRSQPNTQALQQNMMMSRMAQQIAMNPNMSAAQKQAMQQQMQLAMTQQSFNTINTNIGNRTALIQGLSQAGSTNPLLAQAVNNQIATLDQDVRRQMSTNSVVGKAYSGLINPNLGANTAANVIASTDVGLNALFSSNTANLAFGPNDINSWNYNDIWTSTNNALINPSFGSGTGTLGTTTLPVPVQQNAVNKNLNPKTAALQPMTLPR